MYRSDDDRNSRPETWLSDMLRVADHPPYRHQAGNFPENRKTHCLTIAGLSQVHEMLIAGICKCCWSVTEPLPSGPFILTMKAGTMPNVKLALFIGEIRSTLDGSSRSLRMAKWLSPKSPVCPRWNRAQPRRRFATRGTRPSPTVWKARTCTQSA